MQGMNIENMSKIRKICVYCGSGPGTDPGLRGRRPRLRQNPRQKRHRPRLWRRRRRHHGRDRQCGDLDHGGEVTGIIPEFLIAREHAPRGTQGLIVTPDMHERKRQMFELADAFVALPGGVGTLEELVEQLTWVQLGRHRKPVMVANIESFWEPLCALLDHMKKLEFIRGDRASICWSPTRSTTFCRCCRRPRRRCRNRPSG